ncbi:MAG: sigma-54-dependent Fis family transcriptional regulator [Candidatus Desulfofervidaceae bacterium]|nr:sigma-54-dependent Fis family transcriptional regulator [Candidatus Desulfofervidaceae bacterium]
MTSSGPHILVVDDNKEICEILKEFLEQAGYKVYTGCNGKEAMNIISNNVIDVVISDLRMPEMDGIELIKKIKSFDPTIDVVMLTGYPSIDTAVEAVKLGAYDYLTKPVDFRKLRIILEKLLEQRALKKRASLLEKKFSGNYIFEGMVGQSLAMLNIFTTIKHIAKYPTSVLITGETGTGKEMVARAIHNLSPRVNKPFVTINCAGLVETLLESELFGHVKGAFTGAVRSKPGLFEIADKGTIFLDEIGDIPPSVQAKLLRVLEQHEIQRVGDVKTRKIDVRVIAATNRDLKKMVEEGKYRKDLFYRLNTIHIHIPPLRERKEDIPILAQYFIRQLNQEIGKDVKGINDQVAELFQRLSWDGNVRELRNIVERAYIMTSGEYITLKDLPSEYHQKKQGKTPALEPSTQTTLAEVEKKYIMKVLQITSGNRSQTARILGVSRRSLYRKLKKYGLG